MLLYLLISTFKCYLRALPPALAVVLSDQFICSVWLWVMNKIEEKQRKIRRDAGRAGVMQKVGDLYRK